MDKSTERETIEIEENHINSGEEYVDDVTEPEVKEVSEINVLIIVYQIVHKQTECIFLY